MIKKDKVIRQIDNELWNKFVATSRLKGHKVTEQLELLIKKYLDKQ